MKSFGELLREKKKEENEKMIRGFLSVPMKYQIDWDARKEYLPRVENPTFLECGHPEDDRFISKTGYQYPWWNKSMNVEDFEGGEMLPEIIFFTVFCSGEYEGKYGGSSWHIYKAFVSKENAEKSLCPDSEWERWWVVEAHRKR